MIGKIVQELRPLMKAKGCPLPIVIGPEQKGTATWGKPRIVIELDPDVGDSFASPKTQSLNPNIRRICIAAYKATLYVQVTKPNPIVYEHQELAQNARDILVVALELLAREKHNEFIPIHGSFVEVEDFKGSESAAGAAYELRFTFDRAIKDVTWQGAKQDEFTIPAGGVKNTTKVSAQNAETTDIPDTACGA